MSESGCPGLKDFQDVFDHLWFSLNDRKYIFYLNQNLSSLNIHRQSTNNNPVHPQILVILIQTSYFLIVKNLKEILLPSQYSCAEFKISNAIWYCVGSA